MTTENWPTEKWFRHAIGKRAAKRVEQVFGISLDELAKKLAANDLTDLERRKFSAFMDSEIARNDARLVRFESKYAAFLKEAVEMTEASSG